MAGYNLQEVKTMQTERAILPALRDNVLKECIRLIASSENTRLSRLLSRVSDSQLPLSTLK
jgi:hypothetical protein